MQIVTRSHQPSCHFSVGRITSEHSDLNFKTGSMFFANKDQSRKAWTPAGLKSMGIGLGNIPVVRLELGYDNAEDVVAAAVAWNYRGIPVVITMKSYDREPMFGQDGSQQSMFGLPPELAYSFASIHGTGFAFAATPALVKKVVRFYRKSRLVHVVDHPASALSGELLQRLN